MTAWEPHTVRQIFAPLVPEKVAAAYEKLLEANGVQQSEAADFFGDAEMAETLVGFGMAMVSELAAGRPLIEPADPELALQGVLGSLQAQVLHLQQLLVEGTRRAAEARNMRAQGKTPRPDLIRVLTDPEEIGRLSGSLIQDARQDFMEVDAYRRDITASVEWQIDGPPGVTHRAIYDEEFVQDEAGRRALSAAIASGHQVRWRPYVCTKMQICDTGTALVALTQTGMTAALWIQSRELVAALREYFELMWRAATPIAGTGTAAGGDGLTPEQREVLHLLVAGLSQERIAERLNKGLSTIRRRQSEVYEALGVTNPYAVGAEAQRRGWLTAPGSDQA